MSGKKKIVFNMVFFLKSHMKTDKAIEIAMCTIKSMLKCTSSKMKMHLQLIMAIYDRNKISIDVNNWTRE